MFLVYFSRRIVFSLFMTERVRTRGEEVRRCRCCETKSYILRMSKPHSLGEAGEGVPKEREGSGEEERSWWLSIFSEDNPYQKI